jgi:type IV secretion system protein TrbL
MPVTSETTNDLMSVFSNTVTSGFSALTGPVNGIFGLMIALVVAMTGIQWAISSNRDALAGAFSKILLIGAFAYIINDWQGLSETIFAGFLQLGLTAGGGTISSADFLNPGAVIETGWQIVKALGDAPTTTEDPLDVIGNLIDAIIIGISMLGIMVAFAILALQIIVTLLEFKIVTLGGFILMPFGILSKTAFMAERPLGYVVSSGLKVLALAIVISGAQAVFAQLTPSPEPDIYEAMTILTASIILAMLSLFAPNLAAALVSGGPALGAGALAVGGLAVGGAAGVAAAGIAGAGAAAGGAASGAASKIASSSKAAAGASAGKPPSGPSLGPSGSASGASSSKPSTPTGGANSSGNRSGSMSASGSTAPSTSGTSPSGNASGGSSSAGSGLSSGGGTAPQNFHRFPEKGGAASSGSSSASRSNAFNAYFAANAARQLLPANENSGSLSPSIREED